MPRSLLLLLLFSVALSVALASDALVIHRRRECAVESLARTAFAEVSAIDDIFNASSSVSAIAWSRVDACGSGAAVDCTKSSNTVLADGKLALSTAARVAATISQVESNASTRVRVHAAFAVNTTDATLSLSLPRRDGATVVSFRVLSSPSRLRLASANHNWSVEVAAPCPLVSSTKVHIVDLEWSPDRWLRWHWDGHLLHEARLPKRERVHNAATVTVDLSVAAGAIHIKSLEVQRIASGQDDALCRPRVQSPDANCRHHTRLEPRLGADQGYLSLAQVYDFIRSVPTMFPPKWTTLDEIGVSTQNRSLLALCVGACARPDAPQVLFTGMHHAREPISMMNLVYTIDVLALDVANGITDTLTLLQTRQLWFVLVVNPDGYARNEALEMWKENRSGQRKNARAGCANAGDSGVDLNRNYDVCFSQDNVGSSEDPCGEDYRGPAPFSEPEALAIKRLVERSHFTVSLNYHSFGRFFNVPFACQALDTPRATNLTVFENWAKEMTRYNGFAYGQPWKDSNLYSVNGETSDWLWNAHGIFAMSPEVGPAFSTRVDQGFWPARDDVPALAIELHYSNVVAARLAGPQYDMVVTNVTREVGDENDRALLRVELLIENRGLRTAGDVEIVLATSLEETDNATTTFYTTTTIPSAEIGTVQENKASTRVLAIPEVAVVHVVVRDALSCQYIRLTTHRPSRNATHAAFQQFDALELPLCGFCRTLGRSTTQLAAVGDASSSCSPVNDLVTAERLSRVRAMRFKTLKRSNATKENRDGAATTAPVVAESTMPVTKSPTETQPPHAPTETQPTPTSASQSSSAPTPTAASSSTTSPVDDTVSAAAKSSTLSSSAASFASVPMVAMLVVVALSALLFIVRRRRRANRKSDKGITSIAGGRGAVKPGQRKTYVKVRNDEADADDVEEAEDPVRRADSDDEDAEYGRRRSPKNVNSTRRMSADEDDVMV